MQDTETSAAAHAPGAPPPILVHGPARAAVPLVLDSPHSGTWMPPDFGSIRSVEELREGEDSFIDELWLPATERGVPLLAAQFPRTYLDPNRAEDDLDPALFAERWDGPLAPTAKADIGIALVWRRLLDDAPIYGRKLSNAEIRGRIERCHRPYHATLRELLDDAAATHGQVLHLNCHSMGAMSSRDIEGFDDQPRADIVLGDRDGSTCAPWLTHFVRDELVAAGLDVRINDPFKGVELVRAFGEPARGRHSLQIEVNKRLYMHSDRIEKHEGFAKIQATLMRLVDRLIQRLTERLKEDTP
jgi:N-formylglutamate deformylase